MSAAPRALALLSFVTLAMLAGSSAPASAQKLEQRGAGASLRILVRQTNALPPAAAPAAKRRQLSAGGACGQALGAQASLRVDQAARALPQGPRAGSG